MISSIVRQIGRRTREFVACDPSARTIANVLGKDKTPKDSLLYIPYESRPFANRLRELPQCTQLFPDYVFKHVESVYGHASETLLDIKLFSSNYPINWYLVSLSLEWYRVELESLEACRKRMFSERGR